MAHPWAPAVPETLTLPSGLEVEVLKPNMQALMRAGAFADDVMDVLAGESEDTRLSLEAMAIVAVNTVVSPKVVLERRKANETKGVYCVDDLPDADLSEIFNFANGSLAEDANDAEAFREDGSSDDSRARSESVELPSE